MARGARSRAKIAIVGLPEAFCSAADTGVLSQNVDLFCASEGLASVVRKRIDRPALARCMKLRPDQRIVLAQSIAYPLGSS